MTKYTCSYIVIIKYTLLQLYFITHLDHLVKALVNSFSIRLHLDISISIFPTMFKLILIKNQLLSVEILSTFSITLQILNVIVRTQATHVI